MWHPQELHPGLIAEQPKPSIAGSGLAPGYTISRAILSDAVALTRGDYFFTTGYNAGALTSWGFEDVQPEPENGSYGGMLGQLLQRTFPDYYTFNSTYALYPFSVPATTYANLSKLKVAEQYDRGRPARKARQVLVTSYAACERVLKDKVSFEHGYGPSKHAIAQLAEQEPFFAYFTGSVERPKLARERQAVQDALQAEGWRARLDEVYVAATEKLIKQAQWTYNGGQTYNLDVVRDVAQLAGVEWAAKFGIPLKTAATPRGLLTPRELFVMLSDLYAFLYVDLPVEDTFKARTKALKAATTLRGLLRAVLGMASGALSLSNLARPFLERAGLPTLDGLHLTKETSELAKALLKSQQPVDTLATAVLALLVETVAPAAEQAANALGFVFQSPQKAEYQAMVKLAHEPRSEGSDEAILGYAKECLRLSPPHPTMSRVCAAATQVQDDQVTHSFNVGDECILDLVSANVDPHSVPLPFRADSKRDPPVEVLFASAHNSALAKELNEVSLTAVCRTVLGLNNVRLAQGKQGRTGKLNLTSNGAKKLSGYLNDQGEVVPFPVGLGIVFSS